MNLHGIVRGAITAVNPDVNVVVSYSNGYSTNLDGTQVPSYINYSMTAQIQAASNETLRQIDGLNLGGEKRDIYLYGDVEAVVRSFRKGGDIITDPKGNQWLVVMVLETWPDWCKVAVVLQTGAS